MENTTKYVVGYETSMGIATLTLKDTMEEAIGFVENDLKNPAKSERIYHIMKRIPLVIMKKRNVPIDIEYTYLNDDVKESKEENNNG